MAADPGRAAVWPGAGKDPATPGVVEDFGVRLEGDDGAGSSNGL